MDLHRYKNYEEYRIIQERGNIEKLHRYYVREENIKLLSDYLKANLEDIKFGICHGTRRGKEQEWFSKYLDAEVIGTEISKTATQFPNTIQWDFHDVKDEWIDNVDFIYSNSFDHSYKPIECLDSWMKCVKKNGVCILEWGDGHDISSELDPFGATEQEYEEIIKRKYKLKDKIEGKFFYWTCDFLIISHK